MHIADSAVVELATTAVVVCDDDPAVCLFSMCTRRRRSSSFFFFFNDTATTEIYTLSLHDALPICRVRGQERKDFRIRAVRGLGARLNRVTVERKVFELRIRSEEHTSELQSQSNLVCRLLLEKKKKNAYSRLRGR